MNQSFLRALLLALTISVLSAHTASAQPGGGGNPLVITPVAEQYIAAARAAAGDQHLAVFGLICPRLPTTPSAAELEALVPTALPNTRPEVANWATEPMKVFDNLYFVGQTVFSAWALTTTEGIILVDAIFDYSVEEQVAGGLRKLGLNPADIKYVIISHGHGDHVGGAKFLQDTYGARIVMAEEDWELVEAGTQAWKPRRDIVATDGMRITLGDATVRIIHTPGHTPGTISTLLPVRDNGAPHMAAVWGGTMFNVPNRPDSPRDFWLGQYASSADKFREIARAAGVDVFLSNHTRFDASTVKMPALARRQPGDPHPYVIGANSVSSFFTMAASCARAARNAEAAAVAAN